MIAISIREALREATTRLGPAGELEAQILLTLVLEKPRSHLIAWPERTLSAEQLARFHGLIARRADGEPIAYITARREFWSLELQVTPDTLIPRPETERLVERALELIPLETALPIADLGTGSGAIAAAIAHERPRCQVTATDRSVEALAIAQANFERLGLGNVTVRRGAWCAALPDDQRFALILSNPPYIPEGDPHLHQGDLRREPHTALTAGTDGLRDLRQIVAQAPAHLCPGGWLLLEHGFDQGPAVRALLQQMGFEGIRTHRDLAGLERISEGQLPA